MTLYYEHNIAFNFIKKVVVFQIVPKGVSEILWSDGLMTVKYVLKPKRGK